MMSKCLVLALLCGMVLGFSRENLIDEVTDLLDRLLDSDEEVDLGADRVCSDDERAKKACECDHNACQCCKHVAIFRAKAEDVCVAMEYNSRENDYSVAINLNGELLYSGKAISRTSSDIDIPVTAKIPGKEDADLRLHIECQIMDGQLLKGCVRLSGDYDKDNDKVKDKVDTEFGCFKFVSGSLLWQLTY